ncbi:fungal-specific transcription factor domain-containing protein [Aspergillus avenaceus]|uniref:Fungal-specific transcription factor domain-containing protein n=1 Tax=Aspergillus avenaceus TaxID=36643 RepID=A0A5N6TRH6_ASPAV|nr:fungal-specific transcription factor domain-containing protein [Aspergillus avenaceus]
MSGKGPIPRNRLKSRSGCTRCKQRKIKCDESSPQCSQCTRRGYNCPGYKHPLKWSSKYEVRSCSNEPTVEPVEQRHDKWKARSLLPAAPTWLKEKEAAHPTSSVLVAGSTDHLTANGSAVPAEEGTSDIFFSISTSVPDPDVDFPGAGISQGEDPSHEDSVSLLMQWSDPKFPLTSLYEDDDTRICRHFFTHVCHINSCFDSHRNPLRVELGSMMSSHPVIYNCVLSMSAAHLSAKPSESAMSTVALDYKTKAISCLTGVIIKAGGEEKFEGDRPSSENLTEALLASILLGMTDAWHTPSQLGITHLHGARILFKRWIQTLPDPTTFRLIGFISGIMAYWEAIASFLIDQSVDTIAYLDQLHNQTETTPIHPNPWSGICTAVFIYLSKAGTLSRQRSLLRHLSITGSNIEIHQQLHTSLIAHARRVEAAVLNYKVPSLDQIADTDDLLTPPSHLQQSAQIYRLSTLLELYRNYPELLGDAHPPNNADRHLALATAILSIIQTIPRTSGITCLLTIPLLIAGSTLQFITCDVLNSSTNKSPIIQPSEINGYSWDTLATELLRLPSQETTRLYWRRVARERLRAVYDYVGMAVVSRALEILEKVWDRAGLRAVMGESGREGFVQWTEVMVEEKLETILG